jgi:hypothetical protein
MKKRHQTPDMYTYGTLLSGLANHPRPQVVVQRAYNLYQHMKREGSKVEPSILNINMMITITGRALDMERFWSVIRDIPESGPNSATPSTYVSIFDALRYANQDQVATAEELASRDTGQTLLAAYAVWAAAVDVWCKGTLEMNNEVVWAMARFLNTTPTVSNSDQVFSLIEQTTGIRRQNPPIRGIPSENSEDPSEAYKVFKPVVNRPHAVLVKPNNQMLSQILAAATRLGNKIAADYYWDIITGPNGFQMIPDHANLKDYLRVLRISRSSRDAVRVVTTWHDQSTLENSVFRLSMAACRRNAWRSGVLAQATDLYLFRKNLFSWGDMKVIEQFAEIIDVSLVGVDNSMEDRIKALEALGTDLEEQLETPGKGWFPPVDGGRKTSASDIDRRASTLAKRIIGAIDFLVQKGVDPSKFASTKNRLADHVRKYHQGDHAEFPAPTHAERSYINPRRNPPASRVGRKKKAPSRERKNID